MSNEDKILVGSLVRVKIVYSNYCRCYTDLSLLLHTSLMGDDVAFNGDLGLVVEKPFSLSKHNFYSNQKFVGVLFAEKKKYLSCNMLTLVNKENINEKT